MSHKRFCKKNDISSGSRAKVEMWQRDILVVNINGKFYYLASGCPCANAPREKGVLVGDKMECLWHSATFGVIDGSVLMGPPKKGLKTYECIAEGEYVLIAI
jgi:apoptosis-inducing factor 3